MFATTVFTLLFLASVNGQVNVTYYEPERTITCPSPDEVCEISLTVTTMRSLSAYFFDDGVVGHASDALFVNSEGGYEFQFGPATRPVTRLQPLAGDGYTKRYLYVINYQYPAPTIIGYTNQKVRIRVQNKLIDEAVSMHWHGMYHFGTPYMDGASFVTECPILPGNDFVYEFTLNPEGTFWYHAHFGNQLSNGMYGALLIRPPNPEPTDYIDLLNEHTILMDQWFPGNSKEWQQHPTRYEDPLNKGTLYNPIPIHDGSEGAWVPFLAGLINGAGWMYSHATCTRLANTTLPFFNVTRGNKYLFRLIASQANIPMRLSIQGHRLQLIATDGYAVRTLEGLPDEVDYIIAHPGERYDFVVNANQTVDNFAVITETLEVPSEVIKRGYCLKAQRAYAVLHYDGAPEVLPSDFDSYDTYARCSESQCYAVNCPFENYPSSVNTTCINLDKIVSATPQPVPSNDISDPVFIHLAYEHGLSVNGRLFSFPPSPFLTQVEDIDESRFCPYSQDPTQYETDCIHTYTATTETVEVVLIGQGNTVNPIFAASHNAHIHGHHFHVLHTGYPTYNSSTGILEALNSDIVCGDTCSSNVTWANGGPPPSQCEAEGNCPLKDTVTIPPGGYVRVRFPRDKWGWWLLHCHTGEHFSAGMSIVINATSAPGYVLPPDNFPRCGMYQSYTVSGAMSSPSEMIGPYRDGVIGLAVVFGVLMVLFIVVVVMFLCSLWYKRNRVTEKQPETDMSDMSKSK